MSVKRGRRILIAAVAISLLIHFILAGYLRWPFLQQSQEEPIARVRITHIARVVPRTPPPPTPVPTPLATPRARASIAPPVIKSTRGKGPGPIKTVPITAPTPAPRNTPAPTPVATIAPSGPCSGHANADPAIAATPDAGNIAPDARASRVNGTAAVHVTLDPQGRVVDTALAQSSGNAGLDATAVQMARNATYTPRYLDCKAVAGEYTFTVRFFAW